VAWTLLHADPMPVILVSVLLSASVTPSSAEPAPTAQWCAARHEKLATVDRKAIEILRAWDRSRRTASVAKTPVSARKTVETSALLDRLLEVGQQASVDAARCNSAGFRSSPTQRAAYRRNELDFRSVELLLAQLHDSWANLVERDRDKLLAEVRKSGLLETL
jgi:hypothetical protein